MIFKEIDNIRDVEAICHYSAPQTISFSPFMSSVPDMGRC
jgi:hypothetical protein